MANALTRFVQRLFGNRAAVAAVRVDHGLPSTLYPVAAELTGSRPGTGTPPAPGTVRNLGAIAGTGARTGIPGIGAADLGEIVTLPNGRLVSVFGDSFRGDRVGGPDGDHYRSVAVPIAGWDSDGRAIYGSPFNGTGGPGGARILFPPPPEALACDADTNTLPGGAIVVDERTYMLVAGTSALKPTAGSWLVEVNDHPAAGWPALPGTWRSGEAAPSQISGYLAGDGQVYIVANSFDRSRGVTLHRVSPDRVTDRDAWQPWTGTSWGTRDNDARVLSGQQHFGELSFREVEGTSVLSAFNSSQGVWQVEVRVASDPTKLFAAGVPVVVAAQQHTPGAPNFVFQPYGGYIVPGATLAHLDVIVSQWNTGCDAAGEPLGAPYDSQHVIVNAAGAK